MIKCSIKDTKPVNTFQFERKQIFFLTSQGLKKKKIKKEASITSLSLLAGTICRLLTVVVNNVNRVLIFRKADSSALGQTH